MVSTRATPAEIVSPDKHRMIVVVTGANSGFGLGICHQLLSSLSLPAGAPLPAATPRPISLSSSQQHLLDDNGGASSSKPIPSSGPYTLTLILACRSRARAEEARDVILRRHEKELAKRRRRGVATREGWIEGLRVVFEGVDMDSIGGSNGILAFTERLKSSYPHITTLFLNAGLGLWTGNNYWLLTKQVFTWGPFKALSQQTFSIESPGVKSADGERGLVWGVNTLAPYILSRELAPLLRQSPKSLPFSPRIVYTSSLTAQYKALKPNPLDDYQLLTYGRDASFSSYSSSKYMGDLVMVQLDQTLGIENEKGEQPIRCLAAEPGCIYSGLFSAFGSFKPIEWLFKNGYWLTFYVLRFLGSPYHPVHATEGALVMLYAALVNAIYLPPTNKVPSPKFAVQADRWGDTKVKYGEVDRWEDADDIGKGMVRACEAVRLEWRRREGLE